MTLRSHAAIHVLSCILFCTVVAAEVRAQEQAPQPENTPQEPAQQKQGELAVPRQDKTPSTARDKTATADSGKYTIKQGDTLWDISNTFLKDPFLWPLIWKANTYISDPDLIYPGNLLVIPSLAPIERAMQAPREAAPEEAEQAPAEEAPREEAAVAPAPMRPKPRPAAPEEEAPAPSRLILPEEAAAPIIDKYSMLSAGFVNMDEFDDAITGSLEPKSVFSYDDVVFITIQSRQNTNIGDRFIIYQPFKKVKHPKTGENYGRLIRVLGVLQVTAKNSPNAFTARITLSFDACEKGSLLTPYQEPVLVYESERKKNKDISGYILEVVDHRTINAQTDIVYLDKGKTDGVEPGDRFLVSAESEESDVPNRALGEAQVFLVKERSATAVVRKSVDTMAKGDRVDFKK